MKKTLLTIVSVCAAVAVQGQSQTKPAIPRDAALEAKVEKTLAKQDDTRREDRSDVGVES